MQSGQGGGGGTMENRGGGGGMAEPRGGGGGTIEKRGGGGSMSRGGRGTWEGQRRGRGGGTLERRRGGGGGIILEERRRPRGYRGPRFREGPTLRFRTSCGWLRERARDTGSRYWWRRYRDCVRG
jgi:hypothetical protein